MWERSFEHTDGQMPFGWCQAAISAQSQRHSDEGSTFDKAVWNLDGRGRAFVLMSHICFFCFSKQMCDNKVAQYTYRTCQKSLEFTLLNPPDGVSIRVAALVAEWWPINEISWHHTTPPDLVNRPQAARKSPDKKQDRMQNLHNSSEGIAGRTKS